MAKRDEYIVRRRSSQRATTDRSTRPPASCSNSINTPDHRSFGLSSPTEIITPGQGSQASDQESESFTPTYSNVSPPTVPPHVGPKKRKYNSRKSNKETDRGDEEQQAASPTNDDSGGQLALSLPVQAPDPPLPYGGKTPLPCVDWYGGDYDGMVSTYFPATPGVGLGGNELVAPPARPVPLSAKAELKGVSRLHLYIGVVSDMIYFCSANWED